ncbi:transposase [Candidatus Vondammii sp. HM_W22]|uniref:transposase n=1 Tax=Candidatus Vondammii sp. HM_W22 TaxID=2687299 RepID=UPI001F133D2B|nr:transposase [Candidatus Vondammii sp. HM_W22]
MGSVQWPGTIKDHLWGILNAVVLEVSNGLSEGLNSRIKMTKVHSRGFRNRSGLPMQPTSTLEG